MVSSNCGMAAGRWKNTAYAVYIIIKDLHGERHPDGGGIVSLLIGDTSAPFGPGTERFHASRSRLKINRRGRSGRQWPRVDFDRTGAQAHPVSAELLGERRRRAAVLEPILEAVPRTSHAAVDDAAFADRAVLVGAQVGQCTDPSSVAKNRDALAARGRNNPGSLVGY